MGVADKRFFVTKKEWKKVTAAKELLGLGDKATLAEIKRAYRRLSKKHHPDMAAGQNAQDSDSKIPMHKLTAAYETLLAYCKGYKYPLIPDGSEPLEGEDWWMDRFGQDPLWGKGGS